MQNIDEGTAQKIPQLRSRSSQNNNQITFLKNSQLYQLYLTQDYSECMLLIDLVIKNSQEPNIFVLMIKSLIIQKLGDIQLSLDNLKNCYMIDDKNQQVIKQISKTLLIMGKFRSSLDVIQKGIQIYPSDWEMHYLKGFCLQQLKDDSAHQSYKTSLLFSKNDKTFMQLGKLYTQRNEIEEALSIYIQALKYSFENQEIFTIIGLLYLRMGKQMEAFQYFANSLSIDPKNTQSIVALGSILQQRGEYDPALIKYRILVKKYPNCPELWNNIGMCFYGKNSNIAAISCLKRALYLNPFDWKIAFNLGLVHLNVNQLCSAFHFLSLSINQNRQHAESFMYMGVVLSKLQDFENAFKAFEESVTLDEKSQKARNFLIYLNYSIVLSKSKQNNQKAKEMQQKCNLYYNANDHDKQLQNIIDEQRMILASID